MSSEIIFKSVTELAPLIKARKLSPVELVQAFLDRIESVNPKVNAFITVTGEHAIKEARKAEREIAAGRYRGPLHGIPYAPKDMRRHQRHPHHQRLEDNVRIGSRPTNQRSPRA